MKESVWNVCHFSQVICLGPKDYLQPLWGRESSFSKDNAAYVGNTTGTAQEPFVVQGPPVGGGATMGGGIWICRQPDIQRSNGG